MDFSFFSNLSKRTKIIIGAVVGALVLAGAVGAAIAIGNSNKSEQEKCEHVYDLGKVRVAATCEEPGVIVFTCGECDCEYTEELPANGHVQTMIAPVAATCTSKGATDGVKCISCDKVLLAPTETPFLGHKVEALKAVPATCTSAGKTEGSQCSRCGEIVKAQTVIPAKGHVVVEVQGVAPTCTEKGKTPGSVCSGCGVVYSAQEDIPALGHSDANGDSTCDVCGTLDVMSYLEKFAQEGTYAETNAAVGDSVAGKAFRFYRKESGLDQIQIKVDGNSISIGAMSKELYGTAADLPCYVSGSPYTTDGIVACYYADYVDIYIGVGEYTIQAADGVYTLKITETSKITSTNGSGSVKVLTLA